MSLLNDDLVPEPPFRAVSGGYPVLAGQRLLIVEDEFLIALDMQRTLEAEGVKESVLARNFEEVAALHDAAARFDLVILPPPQTEPQQALTGRLLSGGLAVVVCSGFHGSVAGTPLADAVFLDKPFADGELIAACHEALARRGRAS